MILLKRFSSGLTRITKGIVRLCFSYVFVIPIIGPRCSRAIQTYHPDYHLPRTPAAPDAPARPPNCSGGRHNEAHHNYRSRRPPPSPRRRSRKPSPPSPHAGNKPSRPPTRGNTPRLATACHPLHPKAPCTLTGRHHPGMAGRCTVLGSARSKRTNLTLTLTLTLIGDRRGRSEWG